jgi:tRNA (guanine-N7-)-methyltransferase
MRSKLALGGVLHMATDWEPYAEQMLELLQETEGFKNMANDFVPRPDFRPLTKFEKRGEKLGHGVWDLMAEKI